MTMSPLSSTPAERALLAFSREVVVNVRVPEAVFAGVRQHFSDQKIVKSIFTLGCYMMMARLTEATETDLDAAAGMTLFDSGKKRTGVMPDTADVKAERYVRCPRRNPRAARRAGHD